MAEVLVYVASPQASTARGILSAACRAVGVGARIELYGSGSLYQRLGPRHAPPLPDIVLWFGPFAAHAAALDNLLQPYQPRQVAPNAAHHPDWRWTTLDYWTIGTVGAQPASALADVAAVPHLALADPERSEAGMSILIASLDRARTVEGDVERGWSWWQERVRKSVTLVEDEAEVIGAANDGQVSLGLTLFSDRALRVDDLALMPNAIGLAASARNEDAARQLLDWMTSESAASVLRVSPWQPTTQTLLASAPSLDVDWARSQYSATRQRWAQSGLGPAIRV
jgi:ABC-type Fe3+ transport system substrate-binding protein